MNIFYFVLLMLFSCMNTFFIHSSTPQSKIISGLKSLQGPKNQLTQILFYKSKKNKPVQSSEEPFNDVNDTSTRFATSGLLIFLDDSERGKGAATGTLLVALSQQAAPILTSTSLLASIESIPTIKQLIESAHKKPALKQILLDLQDSFNTLKSNLQGIEKKYKSDKEFKNFLETQPWYSELFEKIYAFDKKEIELSPRTLVKELLSWNPQEWVIKAVNSTQSLLLLIPRSYQDALYKVDFSHYNQPTLSSNAPLSDLEYKTGLKLDHMQTLNNYTDALPIRNANFTNYFKKFLFPPSSATDFINSLKESNIFVMRSEYAQSKIHYKQQQWAFSLFGHGYIKRFISGLSLPEFSFLLNFLDTKINTSLLAYTSCYSTGTNQQLIYGDLLNPNVFSFTIATAGISDSPSAAPSLSFKFKLENDRVVIDSEVNFIEFIKRTTSDSIKRIADLINPLFPLEQASLVSAGYLQLAPQMRLPGTEWFSVAGHEGTIASLGTIFSKTCSHVDLIKRFSKQGKKPEYYLMYSPVIPCELILNIDLFSTAVFVPMAPTKTSLSNAILNHIKDLFTIGSRSQPSANTYMYYIKKFTAPESSLGQVVNIFTRPISEYNNLLLWIDELEIQKTPIYDSDDNIIPQSEKTELFSNVLIQKYAKNLIILYSQNEIPYEVTTKNLNIGFILNDPKEISDYRYLKMNLGFEKMIEEFNTTREPIQNIQKALEKKKEEILLKGPPEKK